MGYGRGRRLSEDLNKGTPPSPMHDPHVEDALLEEPDEESYNYGSDEAAQTETLPDEGALRLPRVTKPSALTERDNSSDLADLISGTYGFDQLRPILNQLDVGISAKFGAAGVLLESQRYHAYLHQEGRMRPPLEGRMVMLYQAMEALRAPPLVFSWLKALKQGFSATAPTIMFGATVDVAKLYVQADADATSLPNLPVSHNQLLHECRPSARHAHKGDIISLEWRPADADHTRVVLRHYAAEANLTFEQLVKKWAAQRLDFAERVINALAPPTVALAHLVWRSDPYHPEEEQLPSMRPTKLGIFLNPKATLTGVDAAKALLVDSTAVTAWAQQAAPVSEEQRWVDGVRQGAPQSTLLPTQFASIADATL